MIALYEGSILDCPTQAIVNAANRNLDHAGGLARVIERAATTKPVVYNEAHFHAVQYAVDRWKADHAAAPLLATGDVYSTSGGLTGFEHVLHAVGPVWGGGRFYEKYLLASCYLRIIEVCDDLGITSVAIPAISCGIFNFPAALAAQVAVTTLRTAGRPLDITIALTEPEHIRIYKEVLFP